MITSDQVNYLVFRYLAESGYTHSQFAFQHESAVTERTYDGSLLRPGALISLLQKALQYLEVETHVAQDGTERKCNVPFSLLEQHVCQPDSIKATPDTAEKREGRAQKRVRREEPNAGNPGTPSAAATTTANGSQNTGSKGKERKEEKKVGKEKERKARKDDPMEVDQAPDDIPVSKLSHPATVVRCAWNPAKPQLMASGSADGKVRLWQVPTKPGNQSPDSPQELPMPDVPQSSRNNLSAEAFGISALEWAPSGLLLAAGTIDGRTLVWSRSGELKFCEKQHKGAVHALAWSPSGTFIATGSHDKMSVIWDVASRQVRQKFDFHEGPVLSADWLDDGTLATASSDKQIYVCAMGDIEPLQQFSHSSDVNKVQWDPSKKFLASCSDDGTAKVWTMDSSDPLFVARGHDKEVYSCLWAPAQTTSQSSATSSIPSTPPLLATYGADRTLRLWDVDAQRCVHVFKNHDSEILGADFTVSGRFLATADADGRVNVWNVKDRAMVRTYRDPGAPRERVDVQARWNKMGEKLAIAAGASM
ncbi:hypothetical protein HKX48_006841, partial [Thoreauomyces humboldtii]